MRFPPFLFSALLFNAFVFLNGIIPESSSLAYSVRFFNIDKNNSSVKPFSTSELLLLNPSQAVEFDSLTIPLKRAGKLLMIEAQIDGQVGNLIFDTGAAGLVLNSTYFRNYRHFERTTPNGITGSLGEVYKTEVDSIKINGILYCNKFADLAELGHIENRRGIKVLGLFGFELIRKYEIIIDIQRNELTLMKIDKNGNRLSNLPKSFKSDYTQKIVEKNNILFVMAEIGGKSLKFCFDTGAEINAISSSQQKMILNTISVNRRSKLAGANSSTAEVLYGTMNDFSFGNRQFNDMQTVITNLASLEEAYDVQLSGVLGYEFLEKGIFCINMRKNQLSIRFNKVN